MPECCDAKLLQVLFRQARKNRLVYLILAECRLILPESQAPQPDHDVHGSAPKLAVAHMMIRCKGRVYDGFRCCTASAPRFRLGPSSTLYPEFLKWGRRPVPATRGGRGARLVPLPEHSDACGLTQRIITIVVQSLDFIA